MAVEWFCQVMGSEVGPLSQVQLVDMVRNHQVNPEDLVRRDGSTWVPAFDVKGLFEAASKPPVEEKVTPTEPAVKEVPVDAPPPSQTDVAEETEASDTHSREAGVAATKIDRDVFSATSESVADWFCIASGEKRGPLGFDELRALAKDGSLRGRDRVWRGSWPKYQKAAEIDGLEATS